MNAYIWSIGALSVISVLGGLLNLLRLTREISQRERKPGHTINLKRRAA